MMVYGVWCIKLASLNQIKYQVCEVAYAMEEERSLLLLFTFLASFFLEVLATTDSVQTLSVTERLHSYY